MRNPVPRRLRTVRARAAGAAALVAAVGFTAGALWMRHTVYEERVAAAKRLAKVQAADMSSFIAVTGVAGPDRFWCDKSETCSWVLPAKTWSTPYALVTDDGVFGPVVSPAMTPQDVDAFREMAQRAAHSKPAPLSADGSIQSGPRTVQVWSVTRAYSPDTGATTGLFTLYMFVGPWDAEAAVGDLDRVLWLEVLGAVLLVGAMAWLVTGWALRPVEAIRSEMAEITAHALHRRVPVPGSGDEISRLAVTTNQTLDRLERAQERQRRFIADASHELRSPITSLRTELEVALAHPDLADPPAVLRGALADAERLADLAGGLLLLARLDGGEPLPATPVDVADLARSCVAGQRRRAGGGVDVTCRASVPATVTGSAHQLGRMVGNLLDNAVRHARSRVTVTVRAETGAVVLEVADDGPGVPTADRELVFERFARLDHARGRDDGGAGLGLSIAREIAARHGGTLVVAESVAGARLVAWLPAP